MRIVGRDDSARRSPAIIAFNGLTIKIGRGGVLLRPSHAYLTNFQSGGAEPLPYKGLCTLEELCELHSLQFLLRRAESKNAKHSLKFVSELRRRALQYDVRALHKAKGSLPEGEETFGFFKEFFEFFELSRSG